MPTDGIDEECAGTARQREDMARSHPRQEFRDIFCSGQF